MSIGRIRWHFHALCFISAIFTSPMAMTMKPREYKIPPDEYNEEGCLCGWTAWMNNNDYNPVVGDDTTYVNLRKEYNFCESPEKIKCREKLRWQIPFAILNVRNTVCDVNTGLTCTSKPFMPPESEEKSYYCNDFEIMVLCCSCSAAGYTTYATEKSESPNTSSITSASTNNSDNTEPTTKSTLLQSKRGGSSSNYVIMLSILLALLGCIIVSGLITIICFVRRKKSRSKHANLFYQEVEVKYVEPPIVVFPVNQASPRIVTPSSTSGSTDYLTTSEDEGYKSRPSYSNRKLKTKRQRDKKFQHSFYRRGNMSDSSEFPPLDSSSPSRGSDDGPTRRWLPDEYERSLQRHQRNNSNTRNSFFGPSFQCNTRKKSGS